MKIPAKLNLARWIQQNAKHLKPPVSNKQLFNDAADVIVFVSGGPNTRNDFHVNPTEELFYQLKGDIAVRVRPLDGSEPHDILVQEGEMFMLPRWLPHRPQRPAGTVGLIMEFPRGCDIDGNPQRDALRWYCPACDAPVYEAQWVLRKIDEDLKIIMEEFWDGPIERRTCRTCGTVIERGTAIALAKGAVGPASTGSLKVEIRNSKKVRKVSKTRRTKPYGRAKAKIGPRKAKKRVKGARKR